MAYFSSIEEFSTLSLVFLKYRCSQGLLVGKYELGQGLVNEFDFPDIIFVCLIKKRFYKRIGIEFRDIFRFFPQADEFYGYIELIFNCDDDTASRSTVKFG